MKIYLIASSVAFVLLFAIWSKTGWFNMFFKIALLALALFGAFEALLAFGYVVKP